MDKATSTTELATYDSVINKVLMETDKKPSELVTYDSVIKVLMETDKKPSEVIPADIDPQLLSQYGQITSRAYGKAEEALARLKPLMGQILLVYKNRPDIYKELGYKSWDDWMTEGVRREFSIARADAYGCVDIAETLSELSTPQLQQIGMSKLKAISQIVKKELKSKGEGVTIEMKRSITDKWVAQAETSTVMELRASAEVAQIVDKGEVSPEEILTLQVSPEVKKRFEDFSADERIQSYVKEQTGMFSTGVLVGCLLDECETEWRSQIEDQLRNGVAVSG